MLLQPNMNWEKNQGIALPTVLAELTVTPDALRVDFTVEEPFDCFRAEVMENGGPCWEDSCVEIFLQNPCNPSEYFNFETTSRGFILAAHGTGRENRDRLDDSEIAKIERRKQLASVVGDFISWGMSVTLPATLFGLKSF